MKPIILGSFLFLFVCSAFGQNFQLQEEEAKKDKERDAIIQKRMQQVRDEQKQLLAEPVTEEEIKGRQLVEVESNNILPPDLSSAYALVPYRIRRPRWGKEMGFTYSQYHPLNYESDYSDPTQTNFDDLYGSGNLMELYFNLKYNFVLGSLGVEGAYGQYSNKAESNLVGNANLELQMARVGAKFILDALFPEPYIAPYGSVGIYSVLFEETQGNAKFDGTTGPAIYYSAGVLFQLNWLDPLSAVESYSESGVENTFLFVEARQYTASTADSDPDFSTELDLNFGISAEF